MTNSSHNDSKLASAAHHVSDAAQAAREKAADAFSSARDRAGDAYEAAREKASAAKAASASGIESNPLAIVAGGLALGAVLGALLPRTTREVELLGPVGAKAADSAQRAFTAARDAGQDKLDELGINKDAARAKVDQLVDTASQAASSAGTAARDAVRSPNQV